MARILVAYATKHHSTAEIAEAIADGLRGHGHTADCVDAREAHADGYDAVVLGSAVYMGRWRREARRFLTHEADTLELIPFWVFSTGPVGEPSGDDEKDTAWLEPAAVMAQAEALHVREHVVFGGRLPQDPHGFIESAMSRNTPEQYSDLRDWDEIRAWADTIADQL